MRKIRDILRLQAESFSPRQIAQSITVSLSTVQSCLRRALRAGIDWPLPPELSDDHLERLLYPLRIAPVSTPEPDYAYLHSELRRKGVTLMLLWQEHKAIHPDGWQYSQFCERYRRWLGTQDLVLRQAHTPGDKVFIDYAGMTVDVIDRHTGECRSAQIFVAVLGASSYTYAEATWTQSLPDWLGSHRRALEYFGGVPRALVPDNLKSAVSKAHRHEPVINPAYQEFATHYGVAVLPARVRKPRDKAKAEVGVQVVERWLLARLRHEQFFSLPELNARLWQLLHTLNQRPFKKREGTRASVFAELEQPSLSPLPQQPYEFGQWKRAKVHLDYHIEVDHHYYSVPYRLVGQRVEVRISATSLEIFHKGQRIAVHTKACRRGGFSTQAEHRPAQHQAVVSLDHERLLRQAEAIGPAVVAVLRAQAQRRGHPEQAIRSGLGVLRLARDYSPQALNLACERALALRSYSYRSVHQLLQFPPPDPAPVAHPVAHDNLRGATYYQESFTC